MFAKLRILSESGIIRKQAVDKEREVLYFIDPNVLGGIFDNAGDWGMHLDPIEQTSGMESQ
jgi:hypothetical protein